MTTSTPRQTFGTDVDRPVNDFMDIAAAPSAGKSCSDYLIARFKRDPDPRFQVLLSDGGFAAGLRCKRGIPNRVRVAVANALAKRGVQAFARLWLMSRKNAMSDKMYRRFANRLAVFAMPPLGRRFKESVDVLVHLKTGKLVQAHALAQRVWDRTVVEEPRLTPLARAMVAATQENAYLAATEPIGWLIDAHELYDTSEYGIIKRLSNRLAVLSAKVLGGYLWRLQKAQA